MAIIYSLVGVFWGFLFYLHRSDILPLQLYLSAFIVFLAVEMAVIWGYYDYVNVNGNKTAGARTYLILVSILNAARNSFSFFMLLLVCLGYSVVKPSLGPQMKRIWLLTGAHFVFGVLFAVGTYMISDPEDLSIWVLFIVIPLSGTMMVFYMWILTGLNETIQDLVDRKQTVKAEMYMRLWRLIIWSVICVAAFFFLNSFDIATSTTADYVKTWSYQWFLLDGWLNVVYFSVFITIIFLWRPTANNKRFAMSEELGQEDEFEIGDLETARELNLDDDDFSEPATPLGETERMQTAKKIYSDDEGETMYDADNNDDDFDEWAPDEPK